MVAVPGETDATHSGGYGFGRGFIPLAGIVGDTLFFALIPLLCSIPVSILAFTVMPFYRVNSDRESMTGNNFAFLVFGVIVAVVNASCYRGN
jgi:phosphotransferase system  glucose/maltose/N-acetylglucosamine-specific IIC component